MGKETRPKGRPPVPESEKKGRNFTFRSRGDMHERLSEAAAKNQRSLSEEIEKRLEASFLFDERIMDLQTLWQKRVADLREMAEANRAQAADAMKELEAVIADTNQKLTEMEKEVEAVDRSASLIDVMLGKNESSQDLMRSIALELMANSDWNGSSTARKAMADRISKVIHPAGNTAAP